MSNTTDKNKSLRTPLAYLSNSIADSIDSGFYTENSNSKLTFGAEGKKEKLHPSSQSTSGISAFNRQEQDEYTKTLKKALKEAMDENLELRNRVMELEAFLAAAQDEMEKKDQAILELAEALNLRSDKINEEEKSNGSRGRSALQKRHRATSQ